MKSARLKFVPAMINLAFLLYKCAKTQQTLVFGPYRFLSDHDSPFMQDDIEDMYFEAANWLRLALTYDANLADANYLLGLFYELGLSVDINHQHAFNYYEKAAYLGHVKSIVKLGHLTYSGIKKPQFMDSDTSAPLSISPMSGSDNSYQFS